MKRFKRMICVAGILCAGPALAQLDADEQRRTAARAAMKAGVTRGQCMPPSVLPYTTTAYSVPLKYELLVTSSRAGLLVCALEEGTLTGCWRRGHGSAGLVPYPTTLVPGHSVMGDGCRDFGFCRGEKEPQEAPGYERIALSLDEKRVAVIEPGSGMVAIYDAADRTLLRAFSYRSAALAAKGIGNVPVRAFYALNHLLVVGADAGPFAAVHRFRDDGRAFGSIARRGDERFNVYEGELRMVDGARLAARDRGYREVIVHAGTGITKVTRLPRPVACTPRQFDAAAGHLSGYDDTEPDEDAAQRIGASCLLAIAQAKARFWKPLAYVHGGERHEIVGHGDARQLVSRALGTSKMVRMLPLPTCVVDRP